MMSETLSGSSVARFCLRLCVGLRFPVSAEAGNPRPCGQTYIRPGRVSSSLSERGVIPGDRRLAAPARSPVADHVVHHRCDADPVPGKKHEKVKLEGFLGVTGEADTESTFWADSLILEDLLQEEKSMPAHWGCGICLDLSFLQLCRHFVVTWGGASWGDTGRCLEPRLTEPSASTAPQTDEAWWAPVGQTRPHVCLFPIYPTFQTLLLKKFNDH